MSNIQVDIVSVEGKIWSGQANMVFAPGIIGELGIAPGHSPLITLLVSGDVRISRNSEVEEFFFISGGILEVQPDIVIILSDTAIRGEDLDEISANEAKKKAEIALQEEASNIEFSQAKLELANAIAQLRSIKKLSKLKYK